MIGGLLFATVATLFFVPVLFSIVHGWRGRKTGRSANETDKAIAGYPVIWKREEENMVDKKESQRTGPNAPPEELDRQDRNTEC